MKMLKKQLKMAVFFLATIVCLALYSQAASFSNSEAMVNKKSEAVKETKKVKIQEVYGKLPLHFIQNQGQMDERVCFYEKGSGHTTFFTRDGVYLLLVKMETAPDLGTKPSGTIESGLSQKVKHSELIKLTLLNAKKDPEIVAQGLLEGKVNYFIGNDPSRWKTNIPTYRAVVYKDIYKHIDIRFYGNNRQLEYDIVIKPGADPSMVSFSYEGIKGLRLTQEGDLEILLKDGKLVQKRPYIYQEIGGKRVEVAGKFKIQNEGPPSPIQNPKFVYNFEVASYDKNHPLFIDPTLVYSTYLGGGSYDWGHSIAVDGSGNAYVTGCTNSDDFPTEFPIQLDQGLGEDAFVTKIHASGTALVYSTYLGGSGGDLGYGIAVDSSGNAYVTGFTSSDDFPTEAPDPFPPIQGSKAGISDAFVTKINASGTAFLYSTYLGGSGSDSGYGIAVDGSGNAYVTGYTESDDFPTEFPIQTNQGGEDAFVTKIHASGAGLVYSTYLGGSGDDLGNGIAVDSSENAYVTGYTYSDDFPTEAPDPFLPIQGSKAGEEDEDAFVTRINASGTAFFYSTYLGGSSRDSGYSIAVDSSGNAYVTGYTYSDDFPTVSPIQTNQGGEDAFVTKINASGTALVYSTYLGGGSYDSGYGIAVDGSGNAYVRGYTKSDDFPTVSPIQTNQGGADVFVTKINASGTALVYSTYLGGSGDDLGYGIAVDGSGNAYVTGHTYSDDFPTEFPIQTNQGGADVFVTKISEPPENDDCTDATGISDGQHTGTLCGATNDGSASCGLSSDQPDVWYSYTPPSDGTLKVNTCGTNDMYGEDRNMDTVLSLHTSCPGTSTNELDCNDDYPDGSDPDACTGTDTGDTRDSAVAVSVTQDQTVLIRVSKYPNTISGNFFLNVTFTPANDDCADATVISDGQHTGTLLGATNDGSASCVYPSDQPDVWYSYTPPSDGILKVNTCDTMDMSGMDTVLSIHTACPGTSINELDCNVDYRDGTDPEACNGNGNWHDAAVALPVTQGQTVLIRISRFTGTIGGNFRLNVDLVPAAPANDDCTHATVIPDGQHTGTLLGATNDGSSSCDGVYTPPDVWYIYIADSDGTLKVNTCGTMDMYGIDTVLSIHTECPDTGIELDCNDDYPDGSDPNACPEGTRDSAVALPVTAGQIVLIRICEYSGTASGYFLLNVALVLPPANDDCTNAIPITDGQYSGTLDGATNDGSASCDVASDQPDVWYSYTAASTGTLTVNTCGTNDMGGVDMGMNTVLSLHEVCPGTPVNELACNDDWDVGSDPSACIGTDVGYPFDSAVAIPVIVGQTVLIRVSKYSGTISGDFFLNVALEDVTCPGDFDRDHDVDGSDLAVLAANPSLLDLAIFAADFGRTDCLPLP